jgi:LmbE family N-acetylglucosaminyl deacetylase
VRLSFQNERVLAVVAHPDDAELLCAGTLARARADGAAVGICVLCRGDKGQPVKAIRNLPAVRRREMAAAAALLGAELLCVGVPDSALFDTEPARKLLTGMFRRFRPTLVLAHSLGDYHPDHRAAGALAEAASWLSAAKGYKAGSEAPLVAAPALWWMDTLNMSGFEPGFLVDVSAHLALKERMLLCHRSQLARRDDEDFCPLAALMKQQAAARGSQAGVAAAEAFQAHHAFKRARAW